MKHPILGLHHVTATVAGAQEDLDFATGAFGLRLIKQTVNFDNHGVYHFYYGDEVGSPGTIWTTFPYRGRGVPLGQKGVGQITVTSFSVPPASLDFWRRRLEGQNISYTEASPRFEEIALLVNDPSGLSLELVATPEDRRTAWTGGEVPAQSGIRGLHSVTLQSRDPAETRRLMTELLGFHLMNETERRVRLGIGEGTPGKLVDLIDVPGAAPARNGLGTVHHVAFAIGDEDQQLRLREELIRRGLGVTEVLDRSYFRSIYFREPGGILFEVATVKPGFTIDEDVDSLGSSLKLPPWEERNRPLIESELPEVHPPVSGGRR
jgi:glyoxalase family protein